MSTHGEETQTLVGRRVQNPRTLLAFHATVLGIWLTAITGIVTSLGVTEARPDWLLPGVLVLGLVGAITYVIAVFALSVKDPSKLMLGQITGDEFVRIQHTVLGDSQHGERVVMRADQVIQSPAVLNPGVRGATNLGSGEGEEEEE